MRISREPIFAWVCVRVAMTLAVLLALSITSAFGAKNLVENSSLVVPKEGSVPQGWGVEGEPDIRRSEGPGISITSEPGSSPFIYQRVESKRRYRGSHMSFSVMAKTDAPDAVALEFSNRGGRDVKGAPHPGDGQWHRLELTLRLPDSDGTIEFRIRGYKGAAFEVRDAALVAGSVAAGAPAGDVMAMPGQVTPVMALGAALLMLAVVIFFRTRRARLSTRLFESAILIAAAANIMLMLGRPLMLGIIANLSWALAAVASVVYVGARYKEALIREVSKPGMLYLACIGAGVVYLVASIKHGSVRSADAAATALYAFVVIETVVILGRRWVAARRQKREELERVVRVDAGTVRPDRGSSSGAVMPTRSAMVEPAAHADNEPA